VFWIFPVYVLSFILNARWYSKIAAHYFKRRQTAILAAAAKLRPNSNNAAGGVGGSSGGAGSGIGALSMSRSVRDVDDDLRSENGSRIGFINIITVALS
jgi:hypothetical protein